MMRIQLLAAVYAMIILFALSTVAVAAAQTQADMQDQACAEFKKADDALNKTYKKILGDYKDDKVFLEKLKKAQRTWLAYRDSHLEALYPEEDKSYYGSVFGMCACMAKKELTEQRTKVLKQWVDGVMEGEVCGGSIKTQETRAKAEPTPPMATISKQSSDEITLRHFLKSWDADSGYTLAFKDLNGDGKPEAIAYFTGQDWCGTGGCTMLILTRKGESWRIVTKSTVTLLPVRVLNKTFHGWHSLGVWVRGVGNQPGYEAELDYNGKGYPTNPSVPPARPSKKRSAGEVVISKEE